MFSTDLSTIALAVSVFVALILCVYALVRQFRSEKYCYDAVSIVESQNSRSLSLAKMADVETALTELTDSYESLLTSHKKLRARISMREVREKRKNPADPDPATIDGASTVKEQLRARARGTGQLK